MEADAIKGLRALILGELAASYPPRERPIDAFASGGNTLVIAVNSHDRDSMPSKDLTNSCAHGAQANNCHCGHVPSLAKT